MILDDTRLRNRNTSSAMALTSALEKQFLSLANRIIYGRLEVRTPARTSFFFQGIKTGPNVVLQLNRRRAIERLFSGGSTEFAKAYVDGDWDTDNLADFLYLATLNQESWDSKYNVSTLKLIFAKAMHRLRKNTRRGSKRNIAAHYDLGNSFYQSWLDKSMTYSTGLFFSGRETLEAAQINKFNRFIEQLDIRSEHHLLDIGGGWGGFACYAAEKVGCRVTTVTISAAQLAYTKDLIVSKGLTDTVTASLTDYRDIHGQFDRIASIEMFESVGEKYWPVFFRKMRHLLLPDGLALLQIIVMREELFSAYKNRVDFIQQHIFPGGMLPSLSRLHTLANDSQFYWKNDTSYRMDYAQTLSLWSQRFERAKHLLLLENFDEAFIRRWRYYLSYCEAGFRSGRTDLLQTLLSPIN